MSTMFNRLFKSEYSVEDDLPAWRKRSRSSSFTLPSALMPSRVPSNRFIGSSRTVPEGPVLLQWPDHWGTGETSRWYRQQRRHGSTAIHKMQLRKEHRNPFY